MSNTKIGTTEDLAAIYRTKRRSQVVNMHLLNLKIQKDKPICFVEGEDNKYYRIRVDLITSKDSYFIKCDGKKGVLEIYRKIKSSHEYNDYKFLFFVDSDFDDKIRNSEIYETPCYSVENLYTTEKSFINILLDEFNLSEDDLDFKKCIEIFRKRFSEFHGVVIELNAWIACISKINGVRNEDSKIKMNLRDLSVTKDIAEISLDRVILKHTLKEIEAKLNITEHLPQIDIENQMAYFDPDNYRLIFRGKFELEFFKTFLERLQEDRNRKSGRLIFENRAKVNMRLEGNILSLLSQYAYTPQCLNEYIYTNWFKKGVHV